MRKRVPDEATCAICGRHFDPSETRGWCPNPSCGEWQHPEFPLGGGAEEPDEPTDSGTTSATSEPTKTCPECGNEVPENANFCDNCANPLDDVAAADSEEETEETDGLQCPDCGFDLSGIPTDELTKCPVCMYDVTPILEEDREDTTADGEDTTPDRAETPERKELTECPNCGEDLTPIPRDMRTVCPGCRVDLETYEGAGREPEPADTGPSTATEAEDEAVDSEPIETVDAIATGYEPRLREAGVTTAGALLDADPDELSTKTGISARRIRGWIEDARDQLGDEAPEPSDRGAGAGGQETAIRRSPDELVLEVRGREVSVTDGQTVGAEVRSAMVEAGASEQEAVYVHRKHVRIDADGDEFYLTRLGENSLEVNGRSVEKGDRVAIGDGDEITFSDVVTATVSVR